MLHEFLASNHDELVQRCKAKVVKRLGSRATPGELEHGIPLLLGQLVEALRLEESADATESSATSIGSSAGRHGSDLLRCGFTVDEVVRDYGDLCQAVTELAHESDAPITVDEFHTFNRCLDDAIAGAVTEFGRQRDRAASEESNRTMNERLGVLAHELRNKLHAAMLAYEAIKSGRVALAGTTGALLGRSLVALNDLIDRSLADVRLTNGLDVQREHFSIRILLDEIWISANMDAKERDVSFTIAPVDPKLAVECDRQMISAAIANLLQNAFKFSRPNGHVVLTVSAASNQIAIDIQDECGGLPDGKTEELFLPFAQQSSDRTGLGLGLSISRRGVEANGGRLRVRNLPGEGCVFTIELPARSVDDA